MPSRQLRNSPPGRSPVDLAYPFSGLWTVRNSPADRIPSHGTRLFATSYAIDFVAVDAAGRSAAVTARTLVACEPPERFLGFGQVVSAPLDGTVVTVHDGEEDHAAFRGLPSLWYAATQARRVAAGWPALAGNHILIRGGSGVVVALCHLRRGSIRVEPGSRVECGAALAQCGNSGNSTEPHLHVQAMDAADPRVASALPVSFAGELPRNGRFVNAP